jgi:plastocyanin
VRRHPLRRSAHVIPELAITLVVVGCSLSGPSGTQRPSPEAAVVVATAAGQTLAFVPDEVTVPAATTVMITFRNGSTVAHNLVFTEGVEAATRTIVEPGAFDELVLVPPTAGDYPFVCTIHAGMTGTLIVEPRSG